MIACIDFGNTRAKAALFLNGKMVQNISVDYSRVSELHLFLQQADIKAIAVCDVSGKGENILHVFSEQSKIHHLNAATPLPFINDYATPQTLGADRIAAIAGAQMLYPRANCLVIDCGTCLTSDFITADGHYVGGTISPGLHMRLKAMHTFTGKLPMVDLKIPESFPGNDTASCMLHGAFTAMLDEISGLVQRYNSQYGPSKLLICGGDAELFAEHLNLNIFAAPNLVLYGLYQIYLQHDT